MQNSVSLNEPIYLHKTEAKQHKELFDKSEVDQQQIKWKSKKKENSLN